MNSRLRTVATALVGTASLLVATLPLASAAPASVATPAQKKREAPTACLASSVSPGSSTRARYVWKRLRAAGYAPGAAAGVISYLDSVSSVAPHAINRTAKRVGIAQWPATRWKSYVSWVESRDKNRWDFTQQLGYLLLEMKAGTNGFNDTRFRNRDNAARAARVFNRTFLPMSTDPSVVAAGLTAKADGWLRILGPSQIVKEGDTITYGGSTRCTPPGVEMERCPRMPNSYKEDFANYTGFAWEDMSESARRMSRCVYIRFPSIVVQGTYNGHSPSWSQAIDFMMPRGCVTGPDGSYTRSEADLRMGNRLARYLFANHERFNLDYLIWQDSIRNPTERSEENRWAPVADWRDDGYNNGDCTNTHYDHIHTSVYADTLAAGLPEPGLNPDGQPW